MQAVSEIRYGVCSETKICSSVEYRNDVHSFNYRLYHKLYFPLSPINLTNNAPHAKGPKIFNDVVYNRICTFQNTRRLRFLLFVYYYI